MAKIVMLKEVRRQEIFVNLDKITYIRHQDQGSRIFFVNDEAIDVEEGPINIFAKAKAGTLP